jgi:hypothetical protein
VNKWASCLNGPSTSSPAQKQSTSSSNKWPILSLLQLVVHVLVDVEPLAQEGGVEEVLPTSTPGKQDYSSNQKLSVPSNSVENTSALQ